MKISVFFKITFLVAITEGHHGQIWFKRIELKSLETAGIDKNKKDIMV